MNESKQWDAQRYVLDDPTLDRDEFELRMLDDLELADAVADAVSEMALLSRAVSPGANIRGSDKLSASSTSAAVSDSGIPTSWSPSHVVHLWAALAAVLVVSLSISLAAIRENRPTASQQTGEGELAERWIHLVSDSPASQPGDGSWIDSDETVAVSEGATDSSVADDQETVSTAQSDWMIDAGEEYFASGAAS